MTEVLCPTFGTNRSINGTEKRVRCKNRECGARYYTLSNLFVPFAVPLVDQTITDTYTLPDGDIYMDGAPTTTDLDILRVFYKILSGTSIRVSKKDTIEKIIWYLRRELIKL